MNDMPVVITFDISSYPDPNERGRIQSMFQRLGWEQLGGSAYRYPPLGSEQPTEDWFTHVVPALMLFRCAVLASAGELTKLTLDVQSSTGYNPETRYGTLPQCGSDIELHKPSNTAFGKNQLRE